MLLCASGLSILRPIKPINPCPMYACAQMVCPYGSHTLVDSNGCRSCPTCLPEQPCPAIMCPMMQACVYGSVTTTDANGCPGCPTCISKPICPAVMCPMIACASGSTTTVDANGCQGCPSCLPSPVS